MNTITPEIVEWTHKAAAGLSASRRWFGSDAEDVAQDALARVHRLMSSGKVSFETDNHMKAYIVAAIRSTARNDNVKAAKENAVTFSINAVGEDDKTFDIPEVVDERREEALVELRDKALSCVSGEDHYILSLLFSGADNKQIAELIDRTKGYVAVRKYYIIKQIKKRYGEAA